MRKWFHSVKEAYAVGRKTGHGRVVSALGALVIGTLVLFFPIGPQ
jgi:hypothetical protein